MKLSLDCSDVIKGLKTVQREARTTAQALKELDQAKSRIGIDLAPKQNISQLSKEIEYYTDNKRVGNP